MKPEPPEWLAAFQARFGEVIRTPLDRSTGTLTAQTSTYDARAVEEALDGPRATAAGRLAVYNRQYWARLLDVLQSAFPLTARLLGYWTFNDYGARFLLARPPTGWDLDRVPDGFSPFFANALESVDRGEACEARAWIEAARIDAAWRDAFAAPSTPAFRPSPADAARLLDARLVPSPAIRIVEEHRPLVAVRREILRDPSGHRASLPPLLPRPQWWLIAPADEGVAQSRLDAREAQLLLLLANHSVREALARLESDCGAEERAQLPGRTRHWLARSVQRDVWSGVRFDG
jgi:hypothetical protein